MTDQLLVETAGAVGWVTFNSPAKHNALSVAMWRALPEALDQLEADPAIRVIVLKGAGEKAFVSGADISEFATERASEEAVAAYDELAEGATQRLRDADRPTIAMIRGYCMGGGLGSPSPATCASPAPARPSRSRPRGSASAIASVRSSC